MSQFLEKLRNDISKLYENADDYNVLIEIGEGSEKKTFKAHSVILRSRCNFFHVALSNDWSRRDTENSEMMRNLDLYNRETKDLLELLQALDELGLEELFEYIQDFFIVHESKWIKDYLYQVIEIAFQHEHYKKLQAFCVDIISDHPSNFFASNFFTSINESMLSAIISRDELKLQEIKIWNYLIKWGIVNSSIKNEDVSKWIDEDFSILQNKLVKLIPLIRFSDISISEFDEYVRPYDSILPEVLRSTPSLRYTFSKSQLDDVPLSLIPRKPPYYIE
ncbi:20453_t:CDS:2 [Gigaspora margarita]|uniref:20453_t:CDS:1 n=1 Tax=Gigaspora margarita TaxID=4874 RepID=A0ABN7V8N2_GIGMA|nr:20453_t:CDS:2 [Gigaspora margarita]